MRGRGAPATAAGTAALLIAPYGIIQITSYPDHFNQERNENMKVAIQGELGSFSHEAAERMLPRCTVVPCARSAEVFDRVESGSVGAAVIPIENTLAGTVAEHADLMLTRGVFIQGEYLLRIVHNVIAGRDSGNIVLLHDGGGDRARTVAALA